jgi:DNA-binding CsgD family transcriptional regulator
MPIVEAAHPHPYSDTPSPKRLGTVSPLDPEFFLGIDEFADELLTRTGSGKYSPAWVAARLDESAQEALTHLKRAQAKARDVRSPEFRRFAVDTTIQAGLGGFFAAKFRAGVLFAIYQRTGNREALEQAIAANRASREAWATLAGAATGIYRDDITFGPDYYQRGHWRDRLAAMDADIADMEKLLALPAGQRDLATQVAPRVVEQAIRAVHAQTVTDAGGRIPVRHEPAAVFQRGQSLAVSVQVSPPGISGVNLRYRRVNQAEHWQSVEMSPAGGAYQAVIPAQYTDSPFPLQYHFQIHADGRPSSLHPGLQPGWKGQPYFVVRQV